MKVAFALPLAICLAACTSRPDHPLPHSWPIPSTGRAVLQSGLCLSDAEADAFAAKIRRSLGAKFGTRDDFEFVTMNDNDGLMVSLWQDNGVFGVWLKKVFGHWRVWGFEPPFYEGKAIKEPRNEKRSGGVITTNI